MNGKKGIIRYVLFLLFLSPFLISINAFAIPINPDHIVWEPDPNFDKSALSATMHFVHDNSDHSNSFRIIIYNTTDTSGYSNFEDSTILLTGIGINLGGIDIIHGHIFEGEYLTGIAPLAATEYSDNWGWKHYWDAPPGPTTGFNTPLQGTDYSVDTTISTLQAYVDVPRKVFGTYSPKSINGPSNGIDPFPQGSLEVTGLDAIDYVATIFVSLENVVRDWPALFNSINEDDVVVSFGSPTAVTPVPEPATILLLATGLVGLAGYGRRKYNRM